MTARVAARETAGRRRPAAPPAAGRVILRPPMPGDRDAFLRAVRANRALHRPWVHPPDTAERFEAWVSRASGERHRIFLACDRASGEIAGVFALSEIVRGLFWSAYLGFYAFRPFAGRGYMTEALALVADTAFGPLGLHRLEANIQPENIRSIALARRLGFRLEGYSPRYLRIGGRWRNHERWALLAEDWRAPGPTRKAARRAPTRGLKRAASRVVTRRAKPDVPRRAKPAAPRRVRPAPGEG
jgi:[ribosomal protein S5]-alanine N-acetyltransferase